jgi:hypothetical protein
MIKVPKENSGAYQGRIQNDKNKEIEMLRKENKLLRKQIKVLRDLLASPTVPPQRTHGEVSSNMPEDSEDSTGKMQEEIPENNMPD